MARYEPYAAVGLDADPELGFAGIPALRELAEFCETHQVRRLREAGHSWGRIAALAGVSAQALHKKHACDPERHCGATLMTRARRSSTCLRSPSRADPGLVAVLLEIAARVGGAPGPRVKPVEAVAWRGCRMGRMEFPQGPVALLFTDVEEGVRLWEADRGAMTQASARHNRIVREHIEIGGGHVFKMVGEAFRAAFADPSAALAAAVAVQRAISAERWPQGSPIRVRMALHSGVCVERDRRLHRARG